MEHTRILWGLAGCGGLLRNSDGRWLKGYSHKIGTCDALCAEMWGMYLGMQLARRHNFHYLQVKIDSKPLIDMHDHLESKNQWQPAHLDSSYIYKSF
jgi:ribonuclease HI